MAFSYAAGEVGNKKAEKAARELAYTKRDSSSYIKPAGWVLANDSIDINRTKESTPPVSASPDPSKTFSVKDLKKQQESWHESPEKNDGKACFLPAPEPSEETLKINEIIEEKGVTGDHAAIMYTSSRWKYGEDFRWTLLDAATFWDKGGNSTEEGRIFVNTKKYIYTNTYKDIIIDAAKKYNIPVILLAGVVYNEFGGDPMFIDDLAYIGRTSYDIADNSNTRLLIDNPLYSLEDSEFSKDPDLTSFGNTSIQVRRAIETLGYDKSTDKRNIIIESLKDPVQNIYITALHLSQLCNIDYEDVDRESMTDEQIRDVASRYQIGPQADLQFIHANNGYGENVINNKTRLIRALELDIDSEKEENEK